MLYQRGYQKKDILELFRFIDWLMVLPEEFELIPEELELSLTEALIRYEEEVKMPYVTSVQREGIKKGIEQGIQQGIQQGMLQKSREAVIEILAV